MLHEATATLHASSETPKGASTVYKTVRDLIGNGFRSISSSEAAKILEAYRYPLQTRDQQAHGQQHVDVLATLMQRGMWRAKDKIDFARVGDALYIINGHHRLGAQARSGRVIEWTFVVHECETMKDAERLYYSFDTNIRVRTNGVILSAIDFAGQVGVSKTSAEALYRAIPLVANNFSYGKSGRDVIAERLIDTRLDLALQFKREIALYDACISAAPQALKRRLLSVGAVAVALVTLKYQPESAMEFWRGVGQNDGLRKGDPRHTYITALLTPGTRMGTAAWTAGAAAMCWRAWFQGKDLTFVRVVDTGKISVAGTPYRGK